MRVLHLAQCGANGSDLVFLRAWYSIEPKKLYNPVTSLLLADKKDWQGMRLVGQIRKDQGIDTPSDPNSTYKVSTKIIAYVRRLIYPGYHTYNTTIQHAQSPT